MATHQLSLITNGSWISLSVSPQASSAVIVETKVRGCVLPRGLTVCSLSRPRRRSPAERIRREVRRGVTTFECMQPAWPVRPAGCIERNMAGARCPRFASALCLMTQVSYLGTHLGRALDFMRGIRLAKRISSMSFSGRIFPHSCKHAVG